MNPFSELGVSTERDVDKVKCLPVSRNGVYSRHHVVGLLFDHVLDVFTIKTA